MSQDVFELLEKRLGRLHAKLRLGLETDHEAQVFGQGINYFHIENLKPSHFVIRTCLKLAGLYGRGLRNAAQIEVRHNYVRSAQIPKAFDGYTILHLTDLHVDMSQDAMERLMAILPTVNYDLCALNGRLQGHPFCPHDAALAGMSLFVANSKGQFTACWAITTRSACCPAWKKWEFACCSTNVRRSSATINVFILPELTTRTSIALTT